MSQDQIDTVDRMVRNSVTEDMEHRKRQAENMKRVDPFEHIRQMQLNRIRINNPTKWDVAQYDQFVATGYNDYEKFVKHRGTLEASMKGADLATE